MQVIPLLVPIWISPHSLNFPQLILLSLWRMLGPQVFHFFLPVHLKSPPLRALLKGKRKKNGKKKKKKNEKGKKNEKKNENENENENEKEKGKGKGKEKEKEKGKEKEKEKGNGNLPFEIVFVVLVVGIHIQNAEILFHLSVERKYLSQFHMNLMTQGLDNHLDVVVESELVELHELVVVIVKDNELKLVMCERMLVLILHLDNEVVVQTLINLISVVDQVEIDQVEIDQVVLVNNLMAKKFLQRQEI